MVQSAPYDDSMTNMAQNTNNFDQMIKVHNSASAQGNQVDRCPRCLGRLMLEMARLVNTRGGQLGRTLEATRLASARDG